MATQPEFVDYVREQLSEAGEIRIQKMFGEYGIYKDGKFTGLICDDIVYVKATPAGEAWIAEREGFELEKAPPYPGAKDAIVVGDLMEDSAAVAELFAVTWEALPAPKPKKPKKGKRKG